MDFEDHLYQFKILSKNNPPPFDYQRIKEPQVGELARYLIAKSEDNPAFAAVLNSFCLKSDSLVNPYDTELDEAYRKALTFSLLTCHIWYRKQRSTFIFNDTNDVFCHPHRPDFFRNDPPFTPPWAVGGGGGTGVSGGGNGGSSTALSPAAPEDDVVYESESIRAYMEQKRRMSQYVEPLGSSSKGTRPANTFIHWLEINLYYADQHQTPVFDHPYQITLPDGSVRNGKLNRNGYARLDGIPKGKVRLEINADPSQRFKLSNLHEQLDATLNQLVQQAAQDSQWQDAGNAHINPLEKGLVYIGALMMGGVDMVSDLWAFAKLVSQGLVKAEQAYLDLLEDFFNGDVRAIQKKLEAAHQAAVGTYQGASEAAEALYLLVTDEETWEILTQFVEDYWEASSGVDLTRASAPMIIEILVTLLTAGAGSPILAANLGKAAQLTDQAVGILQKIVKVKKALGQKITKHSATSKQIVIPIKQAVHSNKSTTPDWTQVKYPKDFAQRIAAKRFQAASLAEAQAQLTRRRKEIAKQGYQPKYNDAELAYIAQHGNIAQERFQVRFMETRYLINRETPDIPLSGALGLPMQGETGKGAKYWSTSLDQLEDADSDPRLVAEKLGLTYKPGEDYSLVIIDTEKAIPLTGVKSVPATFENVSEFANTELPGKFPATFTDKAMNATFQEDYARHYKAAEAAGAFENEWSEKKFSKYLRSTDLSANEKKLMKRRFKMHKIIGNNEDYLGDGLTKNNNAAINQQYGVVETLNFERKEINLKQLDEVNAITIITDLRTL